MRTYDTLLTYFISWVVITLVWIAIVPLTIPEISNNPSYVIISTLLLFLGFFFIFIYFIALQKQQGKIKSELKDFQNNGMQVFTKKYELMLYTRDIAEIPRLVRLFFNFNPFAVVQPNNVKELKQIINLCETYKIPLIPRGRGTSGYGGALPLKNGIVVLLTKFQKIISIDEENLTVDVECGVTWENLRKFLESKGYTLQTYPSSALSSTIAGWVIQGGYGIGSAKYGSVLKSVVRANFIGTKGKKFQEIDPEIIVGSCGTLGILINLKLKIIRSTKLIHVAVSSSDQTSLINALAAYQDLTPYFLRFIDQQNLIWQNSKIFNSNLISPNNGGGVIAMSFQEEDWHEEEFEHITSQYKLLPLSYDLSKELWEERFYTLRLKRKGPSLIISEVLVPTIHLENLVNQISQTFKRNSFAIELLPTINGLTVVFVWFLTDMRQLYLPIIGSLSHAFRLVRSLEVIQIARRNKGLPYSTGLWLSPFSRIVLKDQLNKMKHVKKEIDPNKIFNPGKVWGIWIPKFFPIIPWYIPMRLLFPIVNIILQILPQRYR
ncbi:MAG: FAD-binding oxidoreductase [Candidatus Hodarchaeota archaeon]